MSNAYLELKKKALIGGSSPYWYLASGLSMSCVIAAYTFKGAVSETEALKDLSGNGFHLSKYCNSKNVYPTWSSAGFAIPTNTNPCGMDNTALDAHSGIKAIIIWFTGGSTSGYTNRARMLSAVGGSGKNLYLYANSYYYDYSNGAEARHQDQKYASCCVNTNSTKGSYRMAKAGTVASGQIGYNSGASIYLNGVESEMKVVKAAESFSGPTVKKPVSIGTSCGANYYYGWMCLGAAFYSVALTAAQYKEIYDNTL